MAISPETSAWVRELLQQEIERATAPLRKQLDQLDDYASGLHVAMLDVLAPLLKEHPEAARKVEPLWREAAERWEQLQRADGQAEDFHETEHLLEPRKMLYRQLHLLGAWPTHDPR